VLSSSVVAVDIVTRDRSKRVLCTKPVGESRTVGHRLPIEIGFLPAVNVSFHCSQKSFEFVRFSVVVCFSGKPAEVAGRESANTLGFHRNRVAEIFVGRNARESRRSSGSDRRAVESGLSESKRSGGGSSFCACSGERWSLFLRVIINVVGG